MNRIIVTRFSAMGDVAMTASVIREFVEQNKNIEIIMVSRGHFADFFKNIPRVQFLEIRPKTTHKGLFGLYRLSRELLRYKPSALVDLHNNLRSRFISLFFKLSNHPVSTLNKRRKEKKSFINGKTSKLLKLPLVTEAYADAFRNLGYTLVLSHQLYKKSNPIPENLKDLFSKGRTFIGIAPFAQHVYKVFPENKMEEVIAQLHKKGHTILLFGGGKEEKQKTEAWSEKYSNTISTIGKYSLSEELDIIANLDVMISMDSSGMHMASLVGTKCVSIWGATHPNLGFLGYGQSLENCVQVEHTSRPSSIYGNKPCDCDGVEAIDLVSPEMVVEKVAEVLLKNK
ncbi:glycosyltransferase family 9 protein [Belliella kenyensis]|uniref:Glycosyltransferase family 9 protein n=1 Tax=Belliella kenyensis TaxID=1472724 RepID=A0ABV8EH62_9BACT|nr:glycosyltransferase family 9 protein [Belliella kenyensis]MCH7403432.1 glycosyltransferase family 9 protein [Belliella kenyensis]MDN3602332.1 glycosyltransferase family 9 protein [Belliella kenyensis]